MSDSLTYRIPGKKSVSKTGRFIELKDIQSYDGFLISNFNQSMYYGFEEGAFEEQSSDYKRPVSVSKQEYMTAGESLLNDLKAGHVEKAILSRVKKHKGVLNKSQLFQNLEETYPEAFVYEIESSLFGNWIGATPEVLLQSVNSDVSLVSLAGTKSSDDNSNWLEKEKQEQQYVTDFIEQCLNDQNLKVKNRIGPKEHLAGPVKHLKTTFIVDNFNNKVQLLKKLHPTPAVCGIPRGKALETIKNLEQHQRSLYAGMIGEMGQDCNMYVNLRCMQVIDGIGYLYVGGGYTKDSDPELEWQETERKADTLLNVIKNNKARIK